MRNDRVSKAMDPSSPKDPRKLHEPRCDLGDLRPEQVIPYVDDGLCGTDTANEAS